MSTNIKGIDVSKWQETIDWAKVAGDGVKFAMIRLGYGSKDGTACGVDSFYEKNVENALANGIAVGCYFYSYALSVAAVKNEAAFVIQQLAKYKGRILYPIAFDIEDSTQAGLGKQTLTEMVTAFCSALEAAGYYASFYCNADWARNRLDMTALARFDFWLAQWASAPTYSGHTYNMWQRSSTGKVTGISGNVDMNTAFVDYETVIKQKKLNGYTGTTTGSAEQEKGSNDVSKLTASTVIAVAVGEIGYKEKASNSQLDDKTANAGSANYTKYARDFDERWPNWYNGKKNGYAWCDMFVDWCFLTAFGYTEALRLLCQPEKSTGAGCTYSLGYYKAKGQFYTSNPKPGDQIFFGTSNSNSTHTGIVEKVDGSKVYTIEGNTSDQVARRSYALNNSTIVGYGRPVYNVESGTGFGSSASIGTTAKKTVTEIADEVIAGKWGNGTDRKNRLTAAGYDYTAVQNAVNSKLSGQTAKKTNTEIAKEVIAGKWGNGSERKQKLEVAGYNYSAVQKIVNQLIR